MNTRNILILGLSQALGNAGLSLVILLGGLIGAGLAPNPALATLPTSLHILGVALATIPAALIMQRFGRRRGFVAAAIMAAFAAILAANAIIEHNFVTVCIGLFCIGVNGAFVQQYRFAASESAPPGLAGRAVSMVLIGGIISGILGPQLAQNSTYFIASSAYAGAFIGLAICYGVAAALLSFLQEPAVPVDLAGHIRPLRMIAKQPLWMIAVLAGAIGYGVMGLMMTAAPLQMIRFNGIPFSDAAWVIESHFLAMFLPSLFTSFLIDRLGILRMMLAGVGCIALCILVGFVSQHLLHYWLTMLLLGFGWNLLFVAGTVLLSQTYRPIERFKVQAANDFIIFSVQAGASLLAGTLLVSTGWVMLNLVALPLVVLMLAALGILYWQLAAKQRDETVLTDLLTTRHL